MSDARVTVCIPAYNRPDLLRDALASLCDQGLSRDTYVVAISDDASPAPLDAVVDGFRDRLQIVYDRSPANLGHLANFDRSWSLTDTPYISFLSHDDVVAPGQLRRALAVFDAERDTVLVASLGLCQRYPGAIDTQQLGMFLRGSLAGYSSPYAWDRHEWLALSVIATPLALTGSVFDASAFRQCRRWLDFPLWHDRLMLAEMGIHGRVRSLPWIGGHYRVSDSQLSGQLWAKHHAEFKHASQALLDLCGAHDIPVIDFWIEHLCTVPRHERGVYLRLLKEALSAEDFSAIRKRCEARLGTRLTLTRLERLRVPAGIASLIRKLDRVLTQRGG